MCGEILGFLRIWSQLLKKSLMENFIFYAVQCSNLGKSKSIYPRKFLFGQTANLAYSYNSKKEWINMQVQHPFIYIVKGVKIHRISWTLKQWSFKQNLATSSLKISIILRRIPRFLETHLDILPKNLLLIRVFFHKETTYSD